MENDSSIIYIDKKKYIVCGRYINEKGAYLLVIDEINPDTYIYFKILQQGKKISYKEVDARIKQELNEHFYINSNNIYSFKEVYEEVDVFKNKSNSKEEQLLLKKSLASLAIKLDGINVDKETFKSRVEKLDVNLKTPLEDKELIYANGYLESNGSKIVVLDKYSEDFKRHTLIHELVHLASLSKEKRTIKTMFAKKKNGLSVGTFGMALDEGTTDYLAQKASMYESQDVYAHEVNMAKAIEKIIGEKLQESYMNTDQEMFIKEFTKYTGSREKTISMIAGMDLALKWQINSQKQNKTLCMTTFVADSENIIVDAYQNKIEKDIKENKKPDGEIIKDMNEFKKLFMQEKYENVYLDYLASRSYGLDKVQEKLNNNIENTKQELDVKNKKDINHIKTAKKIDDDYIR